MSDEFLSSVVEAAPDGMLVVDSGGRVVSANRQASALFAIDHGDLIGLAVDELLPEKLRAAHRAHRLRYQAEPSVRPMGIDRLLRARRSDGTEFPVEVSLSPVTDHEQRYVVAVVRDVTARVEAEDQMRRVLSTLDAAADALFVMDLETLRFQYVNEGACRQLGYRRDELVGMTPMHINPDLDETELRRSVAEVSGEGTSSRVRRTVHRRRDGHDLPVEMSLHAAPPAQDGSIALILVARDLTERIEAEEQARLGQEAMREAEQVMAVADDRERIARDLHDTVIQRLFASGLALQAVATRSEPDLGRRLERVVDDLDATIRDIRTAIFSLQGDPLGRGSRARILEVVEAAAADLGFRPDVALAGPLESIDASIIDNLVPMLREALTNAAKHAQAEVVQVIIDADDDAVRLVVTDDGTGIDALHPAGNGMANMGRRARDLGGTFDVRSEPDRGTTLSCTVPLHG